jgi:hypothetical protein
MSASSHLARVGKLPASEEDKNTMTHLNAERLLAL